MNIKLICPHCHNPQRFRPPIPQPGSQVQCNDCGNKMAITYPPGLIEQLKARQVQFENSLPTTLPTPPLTLTLDHDPKPESESK